MKTNPAIICLIAGLSLVCAQSPCEEYATIDEPQRTTSYVARPSDTKLCDYRRFKPDVWYRFSSYTGGKLTEQCVPFGQCGTHITMWMNGSHPKGDDMANRTVCANFGSSAGGCCAWNSTIQVRSCSNNFFVYQLKGPPGCSASYCVGNGTMCTNEQIWSAEHDKCISPCAEGEVWYSTYDLCIERSPFVNEVEFLEELDPSTNNIAGFNYSCQFAADYPNARFDVIILSDGVESTVAIRNVVGRNSHAQEVTFLGMNFKGLLGHDISCRVRAYWKELSVNSSYWSHTVDSNSVYMGLQLLNEGTNSWNIDYNEMDIGMYVPFRSTIPVKCVMGCPTVDILEPNGFTEGCVMPLMADGTAKLFLRKRNKANTDRSYAQHIDLEFQPKLTNPNVFEHYKISLQINTGNTATTRRCFSWGDPHYTTFDMFALYKTTAGGTIISEIGNFYMWQIFNDSVIFEVQVRHETCTGESWEIKHASRSTGSCVCAVAIREGNDIIGVDVCNSSVTPRIVRYLRSDPDKSPMATVARTQGGAEIIMPSGRRLMVHMKKATSETVTIRYLDVELSVPASDMRYKSDGICGNNDNITEGNRRTELYRVAPKDVIFDGNYVCNNRTVSTIAYHCDCQNGKMNCNGKFTSIRTTGDTCKPTRRKRSFEEMESTMEGDDYISKEELLYDFHFDVNVTYPDPTWPTSQGLTQEQVESECRRIIHGSSIFEVCENYTDVAKLLASCISDVQMTENWDFAHGMLSALHYQCIAGISDSAFADSEEDLVRDNATGQWTSKKALELMQIVCPSLCFNGGICENRTCVCPEGFGGDDCSVETDRAPVVISLQNEGLCDVRQRSCLKTRVYGENFLSSTELTCRLQMTLQGSLELTSSATYNFPEEVICHHTRSHVLLPGRGGDNIASPLTHETMKLSISNDRMKYSNSLSMTIYDSLCINCAPNHSCVLRPDTCSISGRCYNHLAPNPHDEHSYCNADLSVSSWSCHKEHHPAWQPWSGWHACSKEYCFRRRERTCPVHQCGHCTGRSYQLDLCRSCSVEELPEQIDQGIKLIIPLEQSHEVLRNLDSLRVTFAESINKYCAHNRKECCGKQENGNLPLNYIELTSADHINYAQGYPQILNGVQFSLKVLAYASYDVTSCLNEDLNQPLHEKGNDEQFIPDDFLYEAAVTHKKKIEEAIGATIVDIRISQEPTKNFRFKLSIALPLAGLAIFVIVTLIGCKMYHTHRAKCQPGLYIDKTNTNYEVPAIVSPPPTSHLYDTLKVAKT